MTFAIKLESIVEGTNTPTGIFECRFQAFLKFHHIHDFKNPNKKFFLHLLIGAIFIIDIGNHAFFLIKICPGICQGSELLLLMWMQF